MLSSELLGKVLESAPDAIVVADESGRIVFANARTGALLGYSPDELRGESIEKLLPERLRRVHVHHREQYAASARVRPMGVDLDLRARRADGGELPVEISLSPIREGGRLLVAAAIRDVSERKRIESELMHAREVAERANQAKSRFLSMASHDLRQPLQTLALLAGTLRRLVHDPTAADAVAQQGQAIEHMSRLLNALLDMGRLESGAVQPQLTDFALAPLFAQLRGEFTPLASSRGLAFSVEHGLESAHSDPALLAQVLRNLLSNAIKYTDRGGVELRAHTAHGQVLIEVADSGIGIPQDQLPYIYDEFYQVGAATGRARDGYGLGLSIVQRLVQLLDVRLEVHSQPGHGSVFTLSLPPGESARTAVPSAAPAAAAGHARGSSRAPLVMLVDDDPAVRAATRMLLRVEGYRVIAAASLAEAREQAAAHPELALLIADYHLASGEKGTDVIAALRAATGARLHSILLTGDTSAHVRTLNPDPDTRLVRKPIDADALLALMRELIGPVDT